MLEPHQDKAIRRAAVAGLFYPADPGELKSAVEELLAKALRCLANLNDGR
jgi:predicted class III extradiol MEMO1 family dioxygenase